MAEIQDVIKRVQILTELVGSDEAKRQLAGLTKANQDLVQSLQRVETESAQVEKGVLSAGRQFAAFQQRVDPAAREVAKISREFATLATTASAGFGLSEIDRNIANLYSRLPNVRREVQQAAEAEKQLAGAVNAGLRDRAAGTERLKREMAELFQQTNGLAAAEERHLDVLKRIQQAEAQGIVNPQRAESLRAGQEDVMRRTRADYGESGSGLRMSQRVQLGYQANDIISGLAMGQSPLTIATQQGGQIYQAFADSPGGAAAGIKEFGQSASRWLTPVRALMVGLGGATVLAGTAAYQFAQQQRELQTALAGTGRATNATRESLERMARAAAGPGNMSTAEATGVVGTLASTGRIDAGLIGGLTSRSRDFAATVGKDPAEANKELAATFADPSRGAADLAAKYGLLSSAQVQTVRTTELTNGRFAAQRALLQQLSPELTKHQEQLSGWARLYDQAGNAASSFWSTIGRGADRLINGQDLESRIAGSSWFGEGNPLQRSLQEQKKQQDAAAADRAAQAQASQRSAVATEIVKSHRQEEQALSDLATKRRQLLEAINDTRAAEGKDTEQRRAAIVVLQEQDAMYARMERDRAAGGASARQNMQGEIDQNAMVGLSEYAQSIQEIINKYRDLNEAADGHEATLRSNEIAMKAAVEGTNRSLEDRRRLMQQDLNNELRQSTMNPTERRIDQYRTQYNAPLTSSSGSVSSVVSPSAAARSSIVRPSVTRSSTSVTPLSAASAVPPANVPSTIDNVFEAARGSMSGDIYLPSDVTRGTSDGGLNILRRGMIGRGAAPSTGTIGADQAMQISAAAEATRDYSQATGEATIRQIEANNASQQRATTTAAAVAAFEAEAAAASLTGSAAEKYRLTQQMITEQQARGLEVTPQVRAEIEKLAEAYAKAATNAREAQLSQDLLFDRAQIFRSPTEQLVQSQLRGTDLGTDSWQANMIRMNETLRETSDISSGALKGFVSDLREGSTLSEAFASQLENISNRLMDKAIDNVVPMMMGSVFGGGGGFWSSLFGGGGPDVSRIGDFSGLSMPTPTGLASGGSFTVGGRSGTDTNLVAFRGTRGERVTVTPPGYNNGSGGSGPSIGAINISVQSQASGDPMADQRVAQANARAVRTEMEGVIANWTREQMRSGGVLAGRR